MPFTFANFRTRNPVIWGGDVADAWFRGGPGIIETEMPATHSGAPIEAAYAICTNPRDWRDAEAIIEQLVDYIYDVALAALTGDERAREIASRVIVGWNVVEAGPEGMSRLRLLGVRIADAEAEWRHEVERRQQEASARALANAVAPLTVELAIGRIAGRYALVTWQNGQPPLPVELPFLQLPDPEALLRPAAYRLAVAQVLAEQCGYRLSNYGDACAEVFDMCTLTASERRLLWWARQLYPLHCAPDFTSRMIARAAEIWRHVCRQIYTDAQH